MRGVLEKDDTNGYGPETVYLSNVGKCVGGSSACDIKYMVNDYTQSKEMLSKGKPQVTLYTGSRVAGTWKLEDCKTSLSANKNWWHAFTIDGKTNKLKWSCDTPPLPPVKDGIREEVYYFKQGDKVPILNSRVPDMSRTVYNINYGSTSGKWKGFRTNDNFAVRWEGAIRMTTGGQYTWFLTSDDGSNMWLDEAMLVHNDGLHGMKVMTGTAVSPAGLSAIRIDYFEKGGGAGMKFEYQGSDTSNKRVVVADNLRVNPILGGLSEEVFYFDQGSKLSDLRGRTPNQAREVDTVNYPGTSEKWSGFQKEDHFAVRWTGFAWIRAAGDYTFYIESDDGSKLWIKDKLLCDNDGLHGMKVKDGTVKALKTDAHRLRLEMFEKGGGAGAILSYKGPDSQDKKVVMPKAALKKPAGEPEVDDLAAGLKEEIFYDFKAQPNIQNTDATQF